MRLPEKQKADWINGLGQGLQEAQRLLRFYPPNLVADAMVDQDPDIQSGHSYGKRLARNAILAAVSAGESPEVFIRRAAEHWGTLVTIEDEKRVFLFNSRD